MNYSNSSSSNCTGTKYVIKKGDTLYSISRRYNVPLALVLRANPYVDVYNLQVGDEVCIPSGQESQTPSRPPVIMGPGPVIRPRSEAESTANQSTQTVEPTRETVSDTVQEPVETTTPVITAPVKESASQPARSEIGSRNTFSFNYYHNEATPSTETSNGTTNVMTSRGTTGRSQKPAPTKRPQRAVPRQTQPMAPSRSESTVKRAPQVRQTMPAREIQSMPERQTEMMRESARVRQTMPSRQTPMQRETQPVRQRMPMQPMMPAYQDMSEEMMPVYESMPSTGSMIVSRKVKKARMVAPVRIIAQPIMDDDTADVKEKCGRWNSYQDRERFNTIMYNSDNMKPGCCKCKKKCPDKCTQNIAKPMNCDNVDAADDKVTIISYVSRDDDSLQDILDYFAMDIGDLFYYNVPTSIRLKPGCMIHVPGKGDDM